MKVHFMMKKLKTQKINFLYLFWLVPVFFLLVAFKSIDFKTSKSLDIFFSFFRELSIFYVDKTNPEKLLRIGIDAMLESLDPYNEFIPEENKEQFDFQTTGDYGGMGALIRHAKDYPIISEIYEGTPSQKAGMYVGDTILWIDNTYVKGMSVENVSKLLKGTPQTPLKVIVRRQGESDSLTFLFKREKIHIPSVPFFGLVSDHVGYIRMTSFTADCYKEVETAFKKLRSNGEIKGLIFDLRGNPGGLLYEAVKIVNIFVPKNQLVVYTRGQVKDFDQEYRTTSSSIDENIPVIILVDRATASAAEIVAGALQDLDRAVIVGERTFGKGLVQASRPLPYNAQLKVTTAKYYIPSGRCIQAVDFSQRNEDGSIKYIPDSLVNEFTTKNGRLVYDGGGIKPDISHNDSLYSRLSGVLYANNLLFDFATLYRTSHSSICEANNFYLSENDFNNFLQFLKNNNFEYQCQSEVVLNQLEEVTKQDIAMEKVHPLILELRKEIQRSSLEELSRNKEEIKNLLAEEIVSRYYYQKGRSEFAIKNDSIIPVAVNLLKNGIEYHKILAP